MCDRWCCNGSPEIGSNRSSAQPLRRPSGAYRKIHTLFCLSRNVRDGKRLPGGWPRFSQLVCLHLPLGEQPMVNIMPMHGSRIQVKEIIAFRKALSEASGLVSALRDKAAAHLERRLRTRAYLYRSDVDCPDLTGSGEAYGGSSDLDYAHPAGFAAAAKARGTQTSFEGMFSASQKSRMAFTVSRSLPLSDGLRI